MQQLTGVYLPDEEQHLIEWMTKVNRVVDGKLTYQYHKLEAALQYVKCWRTAIDVGAHCGLWSMHLVKRFAQLKAFEPRANHAECFARNVEIGNVEFFRCALGAKPGHVRMEYMEGSHHSGNSRAVPDAKGDIVLHTLDSFGFVDVDFLKIDVEGFEKFVLEGGEETIRRDRPVIVVEQKPNTSEHYGLPRGSAVRLLQSWGARIKHEISADFIMDW